jgi:aminoglycoside phosphotransferase (APT) family kinase protein
MTASVPQLSLPVIEWITTIAGGGEAQVSHFDHYRPLWSVDVVRSDRTVELFVRGARDSASVLASVYNLEREAAVIRALSMLGVPTPAFVGFHPGEQILVLERINGRGDFHHIEDGLRRDRIATRFIEVLADLHHRKPGEFELGHVMRVPKSPEDHALGELEIAEPLYDAADLSPEPIVALGRKWLRENVPEHVDHTCFVQGDTGPGNFVFDGENVWLVDLEISHFGDPMEDLAAICVRDMVSPFADLRSLFSLYDSLTPWALDLNRVRYHRVSKCVRSLMAIVSLAERGHQHGEVLTWIGLRALYVRGACQALAEAMGLDVDELRERRCGDAESTELGALLQSDVSNVDEALGLLEMGITDGKLACDDVEILRVLSARADRQCLLLQTAMGATANGRFSLIA